MTTTLTRPTKQPVLRIVPTPPAPDSNPFTPLLPCSALDLDDTLIAVAAIIAAFPRLIQEKFIGPRTVLAAKSKRKKHLGGTEDQKDRQSLQKLVERLIRNQDAAHLAEIGKMTATTVVEHLVFPQAMEWIKEAKINERPTVLVTLAPRQLADPIAELLKIDHVIASDAEIGPDGRFTGRILHWNDGQLKALRLAQIAEEKGFDLSKSYAYGNSIRDLDMLELVEHRTAVNPDPELRRIAEEREWRIAEVALLPGRHRAFMLESARIVGPRALRTGAYLLGTVGVVAGTAMAGKAARSNGRGLALDTIGLAPASA